MSYPTTLDAYQFPDSQSLRSYLNWYLGNNGFTSSGSASSSCPVSGSACEGQSSGGQTEFIWPEGGSSSFANLVWALPSQLAVFTMVVRNDSDPFLAAQNWYVENV